MGDGDAAQQLRDACATGDWTTARALLDQGANVMAPDEKGKTPLYFAAKHGDVAGLRLLLDHGADRDAVTATGKSVLYAAAFRGGVDAVRFLLEQGISVNVKDQFGRTALFGAASHGDVEATKLLVEHGIDVDARSANGRFALHDACYYAHSGVVEFLLDNGASIKTTTTDGASVLHNGAHSGNVDFMKWLVERGADVYATTTDGDSALHSAALSGSVDIVKYLLDQGVPVDLTNEKGKTPLYFAAKGGDIDTMQLLLDRGADRFAVTTTKGKSVMHAAAYRGGVDAVRFLIAQGLSSDVKDVRGYTPLIAAIQNGDLETVKLLIEHGADIHARAQFGRSAIHAVCTGCTELVQFLLDNGASIDTADNDGRTVLHMAAYYGNVEIVKFLLDKGAAMDAVDNDGGSILHLAAQGGHVDIIQLLIERGANLKATTKKGETALQAAAFNGFVEATKFFLDQSIPVDATDENGASVLHHASQGGDLEVVQLLVERGANVNKTTNTKETVLEWAAYQGCVDIMEYLLDQGAAIDATDEYGRTALDMVYETKQFDAMRVLIERDADVHRIGMDLLYTAAIEGKTDIVDLLLKRGFSMDAVDEEGNTVLHYAASGGWVDTMDLLLDQGCELHAVAKDGRTALHCAAKGGHVDAINYLLARGIDIEATENNNYTPLHAAAWEGQVGAMHVLLDHGANLQALSKLEETVLHAAAYSDQGDAVKFLLDQGCAIEARDTDGNTPFIAAAMDDKTDSMYVLRENGADAHAVAKNGQTALHVSAAGGSCNAVKLLIELGLEVDTANEFGNTPLISAAKYGETDAMRVLVEHGANIHVVKKVSRENLVHVTVQGQQVEALKYVLELGIEPNARAQIDTKWETPLSLTFSSEDSKAAYDMALALCSHGAVLNENARQALALPQAAVLTSDDDDSSSKPPAEDSWRPGLLACVDQWMEEYEVGASSFTNVPIEVMLRGEASVKTYLADAARSTTDDSVYRCKVCVVGPGEWGKTSLVQSLKTNQIVLVDKKDRTVGIDLTTCILNESAKARLQVTFWDFAGQEVYQPVHTVFFSRRTLFVLVVDLEAYWNELQDAQRKPDRVSEAQMNRFASAKIFRWVFSILVHQPDARFFVVGTKADRLEDARVVDEIWDDLRDRIDHWKAVSVKRLSRRSIGAQATAKDVRAIQTELTQLASCDWLVADILNEESRADVRKAVQETIMSSDLGFRMWKTYTQVLKSIITRRELARSAINVRDRMEKSIVRFRNLRNQLIREIPELERDECEQILRTLNDVGDVLWYDHDGAGVFNDCIILDPKLVIDVVREVVRHDFNHNRAPRDGRITHAQLMTFPFWKDMDMELMHAFKALLQHFQLVYPADADVMLPHSDIIVPAYWNADQATETSAGTSLSEQSLCDTFPNHRWCWEYEVPSELSETIFVQFAVQSHSSYLPRTIHGHRVEATSPDFASSILLLQSDSPRDILRVEVSGVSAEVSWHNMRFYLLKMEKVLEKYSGDVIWRHIVHRSTDGMVVTRHPVGPLVKAIEDAIVMGKDQHFVRENMPWMPPDMDWFLHKSWNDITSFQQLQLNHLVEEKLEVLRKLAIAGDAPRQCPALWSLEYIPDKQMAVLRMSSDLSGRCYHVPIEIDTGSPLLAQYASIFKAGVSLFATVVGNAVSFPLVQNVIDAAKSALEGKADNAERVHNLIDKVDHQSFNARTNTKLSPGASMKLLRDLLKANDDSFELSDISDISNLELAVTASGEYVWAHAHEIASMGGQMTRCSAPPSTWRDFELEEPESSPDQVEKPLVSVPSSSTVSSGGACKFTVTVDSIVGLADWDWFKTYCTWQLYYRKSLKPLAIDVTPTNGDSSQPPSWRTMRTSIDAVTSVEMLRECRLAIQVKRRSRIGWTKLIGSGEIWLRDSVGENTTAANFELEPIHVPLDSVTERAVIIQLSLEHH